ncbi:MAG: NAD(P)H-hydrate dehydratase [Rubricoccaceae bacterium]
MLEPLLGADAMRAADRATIRDYDLPGRVLMETAGRAAAAALHERWLRPARGAAPRPRVWIFAGRGNNGGDGFVVARWLHAWGADVTVLYLDGETTPDAAANRVLLARLAHETDGGRLRLTTDPAALTGEPDVLVDALLGVGARGPLREPVGRLARRARALRKTGRTRVCALDLPTGLDADTGRADPGAVQADLTVAFGARKPGLLLGAGPAHAGEVVVAEIGIPAHVLAAHATAWRATDAWVARALPHRAPDAHKYTAGRVACVVGSRRFSGAAVLAAGAAARAGAGAVVACVPESIRATLDAHHAEVMARALPETPEGDLAEAALEDAREALARADAALVGCGLGRADQTQRLVRALVARADVPLVLDADGLGAFAGRAHEMRAERTAPVVATPHAGELARLAGEDAPALDAPETDRLAVVRDLARAWRVTLVLKGMPSVVGTPEGRLFVGPPPNTALATAGTGDVLAGFTASLLAQGAGPDEAAVCALHLGTAAADAFVAAHGSAALVASDLLPAAAAALRTRFDR